MPTTNSESVRLDLEGDFASQAERDASAATKLGSALDRMGTSASRVQAPKLSAGGEDIAKLEKQIATFNIGGVERKRMLLQRQLDGMRADLKKSLEPPKAEAIESWLGGAKGEAEGLGEKFAGIGGMAGGGLGIAAAGLAVVTALASKAAGAVYDLGKSFTLLGIQETSKAEIQRQIFGKLGGHYDLAIQLAGKYGLDGDAAVADVKKLLKAKFSQQQIDVDLKIIAGLGAVEGEEKAKGYVEKMAAAANKGKKASEEVVKGFAEVGVDTEKVYAKLAQKMGVSVEKAKQQVKAGTVDMKVALDAVRAAAEQDFGGIGSALGNSVPALIARVKLGIAALFSDFDLKPLKDALKNAAELLEGSEGKQLKQAFGEAGSEIIKALFGPFQGDEGKRRLISVMAELISILHAVRDAAKAAAPAVKALADLVAAPAAKGQGLGDITKGQKSSGQLGAGGLTLSGVDKMFARVGPAANDTLSRTLDFSSIFDETKGKAAPIGDAVSQGMAEAIQNNPDAVAAAAAMADEVLQTVRARLGVASPSKEAAKIGAFFNQGFGVGAENDNSAERAGRAVATQAMGGAEGGAGGGGGGTGGAGAGGGSVTINVVVPPGSAEETKAAAKAGAEEGFRTWQAYKRRDARERAA